MFPDKTASLVAVFSHPNHELAVFGLLQSTAPALIYLTDGGGTPRVEQTRRGLDSIDLLHRAYFLNYTEKNFYDALLDGDSGFFAEVAARVGALLDDLRPDLVLCDAVEFYNPVHDMTLPIVRSALGESTEATVFEVPLIHQAAANGEAYTVQRAATSLSLERIEFTLSEEEVDAKVRARDEIYTILAEQLGSVITGIPREQMALEVLAPARTSLPAPDPDMVLRYERRAELLLQRGEVDRKITYADHYRPMASALMNRHSPPVGQVVGHDSAD